MELQELYLSRWNLMICQNPNGKVNHIQHGATTNFFAVLKEGHAVFTTENRQVELHPGELLYIPRGLAYVSEWYGNPSCVFFSLPFTFRYFSQNGAFSLQSVRDETMDFSASMTRMHEALQNDPPRALAEFFSLYSFVTRHFEPDPHRAEESRVIKALRYMETHLADDFDVPRLARMCGMSESGFYHHFKPATGYTPIEYKNSLRCRAATELLCNTDRTVEDIAEHLGCSCPAYLRRILFHTLGKTPKQIRAEKQLI